MSVSEPPVRSGLGKEWSPSLSNSSVSGGFTVSLLVFPYWPPGPRALPVAAGQRTCWMAWEGLAKMGGVAVFHAGGSLLSVLLVSVAAGRTAGTEPVGCSEGADVLVCPHPDLDCPF